MGHEQARAVGVIERHHLRGVGSLHRLHHGRAVRDRFVGDVGRLALGGALPLADERLDLFPRRVRGGLSHKNRRQTHAQTETQTQTEQNRCFGLESLHWILLLRKEFPKPAVPPPSVRSFCHWWRRRALTPLYFACGGSDFSV